MSPVGSTAASVPVRGVDGLDAIMRRGGESLRRRMERIERHLGQVTAQAGTPLASHANATVIPAGKRLRPLLVVLAAESAGGPPDTPYGEERLVRAAVAVELVHSATLVHDDVIDGALLRRGRPTVAAVAGRQMAIATGDLLFSRAFAELARNQDAAQLSALSDASSALAEGELLQREDAYAAHVAVERYLRRCELKTAALFEAACRLGALTAADGSPGLADGARRLRAADRAGLSDARRRARRIRSCRADRQVAWHRSARRHRHAAVHPRARTRARARCVRPVLARRSAARPRSCASESLQPARWTRHASRRSLSWPTPREGCRRCFPTDAQSCCASSPTPSSSATARSRWGGSGRHRVRARRTRLPRTCSRASCA